MLLNDLGIAPEDHYKQMKEIEPRIKSKNLTSTKPIRKPRRITIRRTNKRLRPKKHRMVTRISNKLRKHSNSSIT